VCVCVCVCVCRCIRLMVRPSHISQQAGKALYQFPFHRSRTQTSLCFVAESCHTVNIYTISVLFSVELNTRASITRPGIVVTIHKVYSHTHTANLCTCLFDWCSIAARRMCLQSESELFTLAVRRGARSVLMRHMLKTSVTD